MKKRADSGFKQWFLHFCAKREMQARLSIIVIASITALTFSSVIAVNAASRTVIPDESIDINSVIAYEQTLNETEAPEETEPEPEVIETEPEEVVYPEKAGSACGSAGVKIDLTSLSDEELVEKITSGEAGVIAAEDIKTDQSANQDVKHTASVAADPTHQPL